MRLVSVMAVSALLLAACAQAGAGSASPSGGGIELTVSTTSAGDALAGPDGMTLYVFTPDTDGTSTCNDDCAAAWPPLLGDGSSVTAGDGVSGAFGTTTRDDGSEQVTHNGQPLYYFASDSAAGDASGQGVGGVWFIAPVDDALGGPGASGGEEASEKPSGDAPNY